MSESNPKLDIIVPFIHNNNELKIACENNLEASVLSNTILFNWNFGLYGACLAGNLSLINKMVSLGANDFEWAFRGICQSGKMDLIPILEELAYKNMRNINYDWALAGACLGNKIEVVKYLLKKNVRDFHSAFRITCEQGHEELFDLFIEEKERYLDYSIGLAGACVGYGKSKEYPQRILNFLSRNLDGEYFDCILYEAARSGLPKMIELTLIKAKELNKKINEVHILRGSIIGNTSIVHQMIKDAKDPELKRKYMDIAYYEAGYLGIDNFALDLKANYETILDGKYYLTGFCQSGEKQ